MTRSDVQRTVRVGGEMAHVATTSRLRGIYGDRARDLDSAELLVLRRDATASGGWRVAAVHWSSASRN